MCLSCKRCASVRTLSRLSLNDVSSSPVPVSLSRLLRSPPRPFYVDLKLNRPITARPDSTLHKGARLHNAQVCRDVRIEWFNAWYSRSLGLVQHFELQNRTSTASLEAR